MEAGASNVLYDRGDGNLYVQADLTSENVQVSFKMFDLETIHMVLKLLS